MITTEGDRPMNWQPLIYTGAALVLLAVGGAVGYFAAIVRGAASDGNANEVRPGATGAIEATRVDFGAPSRSRAAEQPGRRHALDDDTMAIAAVRTVMSRDALLATPPTIDGVTLRDYLTHHATRKCPHIDEHGQPEHAGTWPCVVEDMYAAAGASPVIAPYFDGVDMIDLKRHFLSALVTVTHVGLTVGTADRLGESHAHLGIPGEHFDAVTGVLVQCIGSYTTADVLSHVLPQLTPTVAALRARQVTS